MIENAVCICGFVVVIGVPLVIAAYFADKEAKRDGVYPESPDLPRETGRIYGS